MTDRVRDWKVDVVTAGLDAYCAFIGRRSSGSGAQGLLDDDEERREGGDGGRLLSGWRVVIRLVTILALAVAAFAPAAASANSYNWSYPGQRDAMANPVVAAAAAWGSGWLAAHGKTECATKPGGRVMMAPDLGDVDTDEGVASKAGGRALDCDVWITTDLVRIGDTLTWTGLYFVCIVVAHEEAHTAGMSHADMAASGLEAAWQQACDADFATTRAAAIRVAERQARQRKRRAARRRGGASN